jgi:hypothetical protein
MLVEHDWVNLEQCKPSFGVSINYYASLNMQNLTLNYTCMAETQLSTTLHLTKRISVWVCEIQGSKRVFRQAKTAEEEKQLLEMPCQNLCKTPRHGCTEYSMNGSSPEQISLMFDLDKVHRLDSYFLPTKFIEEARKFGER